MAILRAWDRLTEHLCPSCGRPAALHAHDKQADYLPASIDCTAAKSLDAFVAKYRAERQTEYEAAHKAGRDPEAGRRWTTYTRAEGPPTTSETGVIWSCQPPP